MTIPSSEHAADFPSGAPRLPADRFRIGMIAPPWFAVPPAAYGGAELVVSLLADGLARRGHDVTLFASGGSRTDARLAVTFEEPPSRQLGDPLVELDHLARAYTRWPEFDVIHDHTTIGLLTGSLLPIPVVGTLHGPITPSLRGFLGSIGDRVGLVAISEAQRRELPPGCDATVIYNGIDPDRFPFREGHGDYLLFVGRMSPEKGPLQAIEIARRAEMPLRMLLKINERQEHEYWESRVRPALAGGDVQVEFECPPDAKLAAYGQALATLFPIQWPEPFGLVMTESMACGTPVIAFRRGSVPEVIEDGVSGFICETEQEAADAVGRVRALDRRAVRAHVESRFTIEASLLRHEQTYQRLIARPAPRPAIPHHDNSTRTPTHAA